VLLGDIADRSSTASETEVRTFRLDRFPSAREETGAFSRRPHAMIEKTWGPEGTDPSTWRL
jgi:hypothetical protein